MSRSLTFTDSCEYSFSPIPALSSGRSCIVPNCPMLRTAKCLALLSPCTSSNVCSMLATTPFLLALVVAVQTEATARAKFRLPSRLATGSENWLSSVCAGAERSEIVRRSGLGVGSQGH